MHSLTHSFIEHNYVYVMLYNTIELISDEDDDERDSVCMLYSKINSSSTSDFVGGGGGDATIL